MSVAIRRDGSVADGQRGAASKYFTETYLAEVLAIGKLFNSIYFAPRCEDSFDCYYLLPSCRGGSRSCARALPTERVASNNRQQ